MSGRHRTPPSAPLAGVTAVKFAGAGAAGLTAALALAPLAHATPTHRAADTTSSSTETTSASGTEATGARATLQPAVTPVYGAQKYRVGVQIASGAYVPAGTTTAGTELTITTTTPDPKGGAPTTQTETCTTDASTAVTGSTATYCLGSLDKLDAAQRAKYAAYRRVHPNVTTSPTPNDVSPLELRTAPAGATVSVTQTSVEPNLVTDPGTAVLPPCESPDDNGNACQADGGAEKSTDEVFDDTGLPPVAADDTAKAAYAKPVTIDVLGNDTTHGAPVTSLTATTPAHGAVVVGTGATPTLTYTPSADFAGTDTFHYTLTTANGSSTAKVTVTVGTPPVAADDSATVAYGHSVDVDVLGNDALYGEPLQHIAVVSTPAHGTATVGNGGIAYTPAPGFAGKDSFDYRIRTASGSSTATVTVTVTATAPVAVDDSASTTSGQAVTVDVTANDASNGGGALTVTSVGRAGHGTATIDGTSVVYTPASDFVGTDTFTYTVQNSVGTSTATVTVRVAGSGTAPENLANTGVDSESLLGLGGGLLVIGAAGTAAGTRRRRGRHSRA